MIKTEMIWHDAKDVMPERNGTYFMLTKFGRMDIVTYAEGKWNAFIDNDGKLYDERAFAPDSDYVRLWAEWPKAPELGVIA